MAADEMDTDQHPIQEDVDLIQDVRLIQDVDNSHGYDSVESAMSEDESLVINCSKINC